MAFSQSAIGQSQLLYSNARYHQFSHVSPILFVRGVVSPKAHSPKSCLPVLIFLSLKHQTLRLKHLKENAHQCFLNYFPELQLPPILVHASLFYVSLVQKSSSLQINICPLSNPDLPLFLRASPLLLTYHHSSPHLAQYL